MQHQYSYVTHITLTLVLMFTLLTYQKQIIFKLILFCTIYVFLFHPISLMLWTTTMVITITIRQLCVILEPMQELMSRHKAYALSPRDCLKTTLFQKWQRMVAPPGKKGGTSLSIVCVHYNANNNRKVHYNVTRFEHSTFICRQPIL